MATPGKAQRSLPELLLDVLAHVGNLIDRLEVLETENALLKVKSELLERRVDVVAEGIADQMERAG